MTKAVMISIRPKWCDLIANGKKTIEVRKTRPKIEAPFKCYIYCTLVGTKEYFHSITEELGVYESQRKWNKEKWYDRKGKVIGEFVCDAVIPMSIEYSDPNSKCALKEFPYTCLTDKQIIDYLGNGVGGYGWHISDLKIYDKPKELGEFYGKCNEGCEDCYLWQNVRVNSEEFDMDCSSKYYGHIPLKRPPQSWCYVEELENDGG